MIKKLFEPFHSINSKILYYILIGQIIFILAMLELNKSELIPSPIQVISNFVNLLTSSEFYDNIFKSMSLTIFGMGFAMVISLFLSYIAQLSFFKKLIEIVCSFRYLTLTGLTLLFTMISTNTETLRTNLLLFAIIPFFTTSMLDIINKISKQDVELCYTLKKSRWWILKEVVIIGKIDQTLEVIRINFAICWLMIAYVETRAYNLGGIGVLLAQADRHVNLNESLSLLLSILLIGIGVDFLLKFIRIKLFKYCNI